MAGRRGRAPLAGFLIALGLIAGVAVPALAQPAMAGVTCPAVDSSTGAVTPAPAPGVDWSGCDLKGAYMPGADLASANLSGANLTQASALNATLSDTNLSGATLTNASLGGTLTSINLSTAAATGLTLSGNLGSADLQGITGPLNLTGDSLVDANLTDADLDNSQISSSNFLGATLTGATDVDALWNNDTCPDGASSSYFTDGCLSAIDVSTPAATPVVTGGTAGQNGWYTSAVTVTWYWADSNSLVASKCPATTTTATQGVAVVIKASCTDSAGHVGQSSLTEQIDTTPPTVKLTGVTNGAIYPDGLQVNPQCLTTDAYSGVAVRAVPELLGGRPDGTGVLTSKCINATDNAGNKGPNPQATYQIVYAFGGFMSPLVGSTLKASARKIDVRFDLTYVAGQAIPKSTAAALGATFDVRATLRGPGISPDAANCAWVSKGTYFDCVIVMPHHVKTGRNHPYSITASENLGGGFVTAPIDYYSQNPAPYYFR